MARGHFETHVRRNVRPSERHAARITQRPVRLKFTHHADRRARGVANVQRVQTGRSLLNGEAKARRIGLIADRIDAGETEEILSDLFDLCRVVEHEDVDRRVERIEIRRRANEAGRTARHDVVQGCVRTTNPNENAHHANFARFDVNALVRRHVAEIERRNDARIVRIPHLEEKLNRDAREGRDTCGAFVISNSQSNGIITEFDWRKFQHTSARIEDSRVRHLHANASALDPTRRPEATVRVEIVVGDVDSNVRR